MTDYKQKITTFIKKAKPRSTSHKIISQDDFIDGVVAKVEYQDDENKISKFVIITGKYSGYADNESQLIQQMNSATDKISADNGFVNKIFNIGGIIALVLVLTASYLVVFNGAQDVPEFLKASLLTIIGFYFGGFVHQKSKGKQNEG